MEHLIDGNVTAVSLFSSPYGIQQLGFRKVPDTSFMMAAMVAEDASIDDVEKYAALRRAQADIDLRLELYTHYYREEFPERFRDRLTTQLFGPGERIVFEDYSKDIYDKSRQIDEATFEDGIGERSSRQAVIL